MKRIQQIRGLFGVGALILCVPASAQEQYPRIAVDAADPIVLVGRFISGEYLEQLPECSEPNIICIDPPPLLLRFRVTDRVYGPATSPTIEVATTDHFGLESYRFQQDRQYLIYLITDGESYVMPRYNKAALDLDAAGELVLPLWEPGDPGWLPCDFQSARKRAEFTWNIDIGEDDYIEELAQQYPEYYARESESHMTLLFAVSVEGLGEFLEREQPTAAEMRCIQD